MDHLSYGLTLALVSAAPGPVVTILVLRGLSGEVRSAMLLTIGIALGHVAALVAVAGGLGLWFGGAAPAFVAAKVLGVGYLVWIAVRLWREAGKSCASRAWSGFATEVGAGLAIWCPTP